MKTFIYKCNQCGAVTFDYHENSPDGKPCTLVRVALSDVVKAMRNGKTELHLATDAVCSGMVEYFGYHDFDRFK